MFKKIIAVSTATMLTIAMSVSAFAATAATQAEIDALLAKVPQTYRKQAEADLAKTTLSSKQVEDLTKELDTIKAALEADGIKTVAEAQAALNGDKAQKVKDQINSAISAAKKVGIEVTVDFDKLANGDKTATFVDVKENPEFEGETPTNGKKDDKNEAAQPGKGGADFSTTAAVVAGLGLAVAGVAVVAKKKDLVNA